MSQALNPGLLSKFRGCMIGSLIGDCLGAPFEGDSRISKRVLGNYFKNLLSGGKKYILLFIFKVTMPHLDKLKYS